MGELGFGNFWAPLFNFVLFVVLAFVFLRGLFSNMAKSRRESFEKLRETSQKAKKEAEEQFLLLTKEYDLLESKLAKLKENGEKEAKKEAEVIIQEAKSTAMKIEEDAKKMAENELSLAKARLRSEIMNGVKQSLEAVVKENFDSEKAASYISSQVTKANSLNLN